MKETSGTKWGSNRDPFNSRTVLSTSTFRSFLLWCCEACLESIRSCVTARVRVSSNPLQDSGFGSYYFFIKILLLSETLPVVRF